MKIKKIKKKSPKNGLETHDFERKTIKIGKMENPSEDAMFQLDP